FKRGRRQPGDRPDAESDPAPEQTLVEQLPSPCQVGGERALGDAELPGRLAPRSPLELAGDQGGPITLRQAAQLLVQEEDEVVPVLRRSRLARGDFHPPPFDCAPARRSAPGLLGGPDRDAVEPAPQLLTPADRPGP